VILVNGKAEDRISISDRGLNYGDGLFETIAFRNGVAEFIDAHIQRLVDGCTRLNIPFQQRELLSTELDSVYQSLKDVDSVIKIVITRGSGGRGYFADNTAEPSRIISTHAYPSYPQSYQQQGISVRLCQHKLSENPTLAGLKHLNRLDNIIARNEWSDENIAEGLMFDQSNHLIEGTMTNVFIVKSNQLISPKIKTSGVNGILRTQIIQIANQLGITFKEGVLSQTDLKNADEVFVCNSINGIWPVKNIIDFEKTLSVGPVTQQLQHVLLEVKR